MRGGAGTYAPTPQRVADTLTEWLGTGCGELARMAENARRLAHPRAVFEVADLVWKSAERQQAPCRDGVRAGRR